MSTAVEVGELVSGMAVYFKKDARVVQEQEEQKNKKRNGFFIEEEEEEEEEALSETSSVGPASSASSSIGENSSSEAGDKAGEEDGEEVQSKEKEEVGGLGLASLESVEDSLPIKRGLSNFYAGKSKSFTSLAEAASAGAKDLAKPENPFNKRRRILTVWSRRASYSSLVTQLLPPLFAPDHTVAEEREEEEKEEEEERLQETHQNVNNKKKDAPKFPPLGLHVNTQKGLMRSNKQPFRSPRSFSLSDLQNTCN